MLRDYSENPKHKRKRTKTARSQREPRTCQCGVRIKQKYFKTCIHCRKAEKKAKKEARQLRKDIETELKQT